MAKKTPMTPRKSTRKSGSAKGKRKPRSIQRSDKPAGATTAPIFVFKVALKGAKRIWRRIALRGDQTLDDLHEAIYEAFDRDDEHLYSFYFPRPGSKGRARVRNAIEYACPYAREDPWGDFDDDSPCDTAAATLQPLGLKPRQVFFYLFDYGDEWWHEITVERVNAEFEKGDYPRVVEKHGKSPPQYPDLDDDDDDEDGEDDDE
jgi:Plasmid pRiA4b ORF-3-like protein